MTSPPAPSADELLERIMALEEELSGLREAFEGVLKALAGMHRVAGSRSSTKKKPRSNHAP